MAIPIRHAPVLEGEAAQRFERLRILAEKERGSIKFTDSEKNGFKKVMREYYQNIMEKYED